MSITSEGKAVFSGKQMCRIKPNQTEKKSGKGDKKERNTKNGNFRKKKISSVGSLLSFLLRKKIKRLLKKKGKTKTETCHAQENYTQENLQEETREGNRMEEGKKEILIDLENLRVLDKRRL